MRKIYRKKTEWVSRGFISRIGIRFELFRKPLRIALIILLVIAASPLVISQAKFEIKEYNYKKTLASRDKLDRARFELEQKEKARKEKEYQKWLNERQKEEAKISNEIAKNLEISKWQAIQDYYKDNPFLLNKTTLEKGKIESFQGNRVFLDTGWYFDSDGEDKNIEVISYYEYRDYKKYLEKINSRGVKNGKE